jgi:MFS family permease
MTLFVWSIASTISINGPVMPLYVQSLGISVVEWSGLSASWALGMFVSEWLWGNLCDRVDRRALIVLSLLSTSLLCYLFTVQSLISKFIILEFATGVMGVALGPTTRSYISDESAGTSMGLYMSLWWTFFALGRVIGPALGAYIAQVLSYAYSFWASSLLSIALAVFAVSSFPKEESPRRVQSTNILGSVKKILSIRSARFLFAATVFIFMSRALVISFLPLYASEELGMSTAEVGILISCFFAAQLLAVPMVGWFSDRFGRRHTAILSLLVSAGLYLLYFLATSRPQLLIVTVVAGVGIAATSLPLALVHDVTPREMQGAAMGLYGSSEDVGVTLGPLIYGLVWTIIGPVYIFAATSLSLVIGAAFIFWMKERCQAV